MNGKVMRRHASSPRARWATTLTLAILLPASQVAGVPADKPYRPEDLVKVRTVLDIQLSPDGSELVYVLAEADPGHRRYLSRLLRVAIGGGTPVEIPTGPNGAESPRWSPDGRSVAYVSEGDGQRQLWVRSLADGVTRRLSAAGTGVDSFEWSPDGHQVAIIAMDHAPPAVLAGAARDDDAQVVGTYEGGTHLYVIDKSTGVQRRLTSGQFSVADPSWSPRGDEIAVTYHPGLGPVDESDTDISVVRVSDGNVRSLVERAGRDNMPKWSPDGSSIAFESTDGRIGEFRSVYVCVIPAAGGPPRVISKNVDERIYKFYGWSPDGKSLYFLARKGVTLQLQAASVKTGNATSVSMGLKVYDAFTFSKRAHGIMAFAASDPAAPRDIYRSSVDRFEPVKVVSINPELADYRVGETRVIHWKAKDGTEIEGLVVLPLDYRVGRRYPMLTIIHGGPSAAFTVGFAPQVSVMDAPSSLEPYPPQLFSARGYVTFMPNVRGSGGYGASFREANIGDWGGGDLADLMAGVDALVEQGIADPERLGVLGWSYGGYLSAFAISQTRRFKAAQVLSGISDLTSMYGTSGQRAMFDAYFGGPPWRARALYESRSPITGAAAIVTPTLIQHGDDDDAVPVGQAQELYSALRARSVPVVFVRYPRSGHVPSEPNLNLDVWRRILTWFDEWLRPSSP